MLVILACATTALNSTGGEHMTGSSERASGSWNYRGGVAVAFVASFLTVWTTIVRDDGGGMGFFMLIMATGVGWFAAWFRPAGMARTMVGVAIMQALLCLAYVTAPSTASLPGGASRIMLWSAVFIMLWLTSAAFFRAAAKQDRKAMATA
ncbi:hypothetical protein OK349_15820 [Sphingomonas sp. BT-65]|uniref:hypothetical protein n=1 Tax=Sphingomonas sp. BT-65 TaxID=2989821 RepID=UPI002235C0B1|nr:hypothetical protein [Sphingomonas sp. BT-65]MCW4463180.1 hypothetical protein [Sphingomonas sp. BT-65]